MLFKGVKEEIQRALAESPEETFGVESLNFGAQDYMEVGYLYPADGGYGNMASYMSRQELESLVNN